MTQYEAVLRFLEEEGTITSMQAFSELGITRLAAVIFTLKEKGYPIEKEDIIVRNRYGKNVVFAKYSMSEVDTH